VDGRRRGLAEWVAAGHDNRQLPVLPAAVAVPERAAVEDAFGTPTVLVEYEPLARAVLAMLAETTPVRA
jgi:hypothetical protein